LNEIIDGGGKKMYKFVDILKEDVKKVALIMEEDFNLKAGHLNDFIDIHIEKAKEFFYPLLLLASFRLFTKGKKPPYYMAAVIQFIYMANINHKYNGNSPQYPVLVGDYLYAKFFSYLCEYDYLKWLKSVSEVICSMHEGGMERSQNEGVGTKINLSTLEKETAILSKISCEIGASFAKESENVVDSMKDVGYNIGLAWALSRENATPNEVKYYFRKAQKKLNSVSKNVSNKEMFSAFENLIYEFTKVVPEKACSQVV
jgi:hypothetical protein